MSVQQPQPRAAVVIMRRSHLRTPIAPETLENAVLAGRITEAERAFIETGAFPIPTTSSTREDEQ